MTGRAAMRRSDLSGSTQTSSHLVRRTYARASCSNRRRRSASCPSFGLGARRTSRYSPRSHVRRRIPGRFQSGPAGGRRVRSRLARVLGLVNQPLSWAVRLELLVAALAGLHKRVANRREGRAVPGFRCLAGGNASVGELLRIALPVGQAHPGSAGPVPPTDTRVPRAASWIAW